MAYVSPFHRSARALTLSLSISLLLAACSTDVLSPPARIDTSMRVSSVQPVRQAAYPAVETPMGDFTDAPENAMPVETGDMASGQRLPMIDSAAAGVQVAVANAGSQPLVVPPQGVNMDAMLGVAPASGSVVGLAEEQSREIAEGNASQPVVGGIGSDDVRQLGGQQQAMVAPDAGGDADLPMLTPERQAAEEARRAAFLEQEQRATLRKREVREERQVAFLPRAGNPLSGPDSEPDFTGRMPAAEIACRQRLKKLRVEFTDVARISKGKSCGIDYPIELTGLSGGIDVKPAVKLNCQVTEAFAKWVKSELAPSARYRYLSGIKTIKPLGGYSCRTMNSGRGNPMSEHARGNAIDVGKFVLNSGKEIDVRKPGFFAFREKGLLKAVRTDSCKYFSTVLGPGSDRHHKDHFHFDLRSRKSGYRHCD
ncbi:extensin [Rhizobium sp. Root482]|nr:extensin [Rhizobium sp. Root482]